MRQFRFINYFDVASLGIKDVCEIEKEPYFQHIVDNKTILNLSAIIKTGTRVLLWADSPEELNVLTKVS